MNPMIRKELRQRMRERRAWLLPSLYLAVLSGVVGLAYLAVGLDVGSRQAPKVGRVVFVAVAYAQLATLVLIAPVFSAGSVTIEKEQRTLGALLTSLLTPTEIWWGKFVTALLYQVLLLLSSLPVLSVAFAFGGVGPREILIAVSSTLVTLVGVSALGLYFSAYFRRSVHATAVTYAAVVASTVLSVVAFGLLGADWPLHSVERAPWTVHALLFNPFFALTAGLFGGRMWAVPWLTALAFWIVVAVVASVLAIRNIAGAGEQL